MSDMSQFWFQWEGLNQVPTVLAAIEDEIRGLRRLMDPADAMRASAATVAAAMNELSASLGGLIDQNASELHNDIERFRHVTNNYSNADRSVSDSAQQLRR